MQTELLVEKINNLPTEQISEVNDFVEFLREKSKRQAKESRFFKFNSCNGDVIEITAEYLEKARVMSGEPN